MNTPVTDQTVRDQVELTEAGVQDLQNELTELEEIKLPEAVTRVSIARDHGDLSENAEYHSARVDKELMKPGFPKSMIFCLKRWWLNQPSHTLQLVWAQSSPFRKKAPKNLKLSPWWVSLKQTRLKAKYPAHRPWAKPCLRKKSVMTSLSPPPPASSTTPFWILSNLSISLKTVLISFVVSFDNWEALVSVKLLWLI